MPSYLPSRRASAALLSLLYLLSSPAALFAQDDTDLTEEERALLAEGAEDEENLYRLSPFVVRAEEDEGYIAEATLAGIGIRTDLSDVGSSVTVLTESFLEDTGSRNQEELLVYATSAEVSGQGGNFLGGGDGDFVATPASGETRIRGLIEADDLREFFLTAIPWDGFNVERVDLQRGPNAILFGIGSPAGIINTTLKRAAFESQGEVSIAFDNHGSMRGVADYNQVILDEQLAVRVIGLLDRTEYRQEPAFKDDDRLYGSLRWDPQYFFDDSIHTSIHLSAEVGTIERNDPILIPPYDYITPWFDSEAEGGLGQATYPWFNSQYLDDSSETRPDDAPDFEPWLSREPYQYNGGAQLVIFPDRNSSGQADIRTTRKEDFSLIGTEVSPDNRDENWGNLVGITHYSRYAQQAQLPGFEINPYKNFSLTDESIFDFYDNMLIGPNKRQYQDYQAINFSVAQTYLNNRIGWEFAYDWQEVETEYWQNFGNRQYGISVDIMEGFVDGSDNPNLGRAYVPGLGSDAFGWEVHDDREAKRLKIFGELDFQDVLDSDSIWTRILGRHLFTASGADSLQRVQDRAWQRYFLDDDFVGAEPGIEIRNDRRKVIGHHYISDDLRGATSVSGLNLQRLGAVQNPESGTVVAWDIDTQAYETFEVPVVDAGAGGWDDRIYDNATIRKDEIESLVLVWQGFFFDEKVIPMIGYREDTSKSWNSGPPPQTARRQALVNDPSWGLPDEPDEESEEKLSWSLVVKSPDFINEYLPFDSSFQVFYNESANFKPETGRKDVQGNLLPSPVGETSEYGFQVNMFDERLTFRVIRYKTEVLNATMPGQNIPVWTIQYEAWNQAAAQAFNEWSRDNWDNWRLGDSRAYDGPTGDGYGLTSDGNVLLWQPSPDDLLDPNDPFGGYNQQAIDAQYAIQVAAVQSWLANPIPEQMQEAWGMTGYGEPDYQGTINAGALNDIVVNIDTISEGTEYELTARPISGLDITFNAVNTDARRENIGATWRDWVDTRIEQLRTLPMGNMRTWNGEYWHVSGGRDTAVTQLETWLMPSYELALALEGASVPELREWRFNLVANYAFQDGYLEGLNIGAAYRWQDEQVIGFRLNETNDGFDVNQKIYGPSEDAFDIWAGYNWEINERFTYRIQLNVRNLFAKDELIPVTAQPDGTPATYRIAAPRTILLTNTISF